MDASLGIPLLAFKSFSTKEAFPSRLWHASKYVTALNFFNHSNFYECPSYFAWQRAFHMFSFQILCERLAPGCLLILLCKNQRLTSVLQLIGGEKIALCDQSKQRLRRRVLRLLIRSENENENVCLRGKYCTGQTHVRKIFHRHLQKARSELMLSLCHVQVTCHSMR